jgi:TolB protein
MNADGSGIARLTLLTEAGLDQYPAWSPDGQRIAFTRSLDLDGGPHQVYVMNADGSAINRLTFGDPQGRFAESCPAWSPDGSSIVFWSFGYGIAMINSVGGIPSTVYKGVGGLFSFGYVNFYSNPDWSPDGQKVVFAREADLSSFLQRKLMITDASGTGALQPITTFSTAGEDYEPAWSRVSQ